MRLKTGNPILDSPLQRVAEWWVRKTRCGATLGHTCVCMTPKRRHPLFHLCVDCNFAWKTHGR